MHLQRAVALLLLAGISSVAMRAQAIGASVDNVRFEKGTHIAFAHVINTSTKDITGFNLSVDVTYQNGQKSHYERLVDFLPQMLGSQKLGLADSGALHPGNRYEERLDLPAHGSADNFAVAVSAKLDVAAYSDDTADVAMNPLYRGLRV